MITPVCVGGCGGAGSMGVRGHGQLRHSDMVGRAGK